MSLQVPSRVDALVGDSLEAAVRLKHRRRLHRLGWERALEPLGAARWAHADPPPRPGCSLQVLIDGA